MILQEAFNNKWPQPDQLDSDKKPLFTTYESFHKAYTEQYGKAMAFKEIFTMIESADDMSRNLAEQMSGKKKTYGF